MSYTKHDFKSGEKLYAQQLNEMDEQIFKNTEETSKLSEEIADLKENGTGGGAVVPSVEPMEDDIPKVFFEGNVSGMTKDNEKILGFAYKSKTKQFDGYVKMKWQGSSSLDFPKKNFTIKMFSDETCETKLKQSFKDWKHLSNKYVLKANYIDHTHARNIVTANLWTEIVASRSDYNSLPEELKNSPKNGAVDGFPIKLYLNGKYEGIYTWNIGKGDWMFGIDEANVNHAVLCAEKNNNGNASTTDRNILACEFRTNANIDGNDWSLEIPDVLQGGIKTSFNNLINCVKDTDDETFKATIRNHLDITSALDYYILMYFSCAVDNLGKNLIMVTYDGVKWFCSAYDLDNIWGSRGTNTFVSGTFQCPEGYQDTNSLLWQRIEKCFGLELYNRYQEIRKNVLSFSNVVDKFERFCDLIGTELYKEDVEIYSGIPYPNQNNLKQIRNFIQPRAEYVDGCFEEFINSGGKPDVPVEPDIPDEPEVETIPCTGISLNTSTLEFDDESAKTLVATVLPSNTTDSVTWSSSNNLVATVSGGVVTPISSGQCVITATCGAFDAVCNVSVSENVIDERILYKLPTEKVINSTSDGIDTGVALWEQDQDFTIFADFTPTESQAERTVFCTNMTNHPWSGISMMAPSGISGYYTFKVVDASFHNSETFIPVTCVDNVKLAVTHKVGSKLYEMLYIFGESNVYALSVDCEFKSNNNPLCIGVGDMWTDNPLRPLLGTVHEFKVYNEKLNVDEILVLLGKDITIDFVLPEQTSFDGTNFFDTGINPMNFEQDFTIALDVTPNGESTEQVLFQNLQLGGNISGLKLALNPMKTKCTLYAYSKQGELSVNIETVIPYNTSENFKVVITHISGSGVYEIDYLYNQETYNTTLDAVFTNTNENIVIGADVEGTSILRGFKGTVHDFRVYNRAYTDEEITAYLNR